VAARSTCSNVGESARPVPQKGNLGVQLPTHMHNSLGTTSCTAALSVSIEGKKNIHVQA